MLTQLKLQLILADVKQADIARAAGVGRAYINRIVLNKQKPSARAIKAFKEVAGISLEAADAKVADAKKWVPSRDEIRFFGGIDE